MKQKMQQWLVRPQGKLGPLGLVVLLVTASLVTPLSLDMYTPAVPHMTEAFGTTAGTVNLTLVGYFLFFAVGLLVFGPLSDRYGRRPVLLAGVVTYTSASGLCALALDIEMLIAFRVVQALGAGAVSAVAIAVVKDAFKAEKREAILSIVQVMFVVGPVLSPVVGALILQVFDWRMTFCALGAVGVFCCALAVLFEETLPQEERYRGTVLGSIGQLGAVARNKGFSSFLAIVGLYNLPFMAYIAVGSYVYISFFGLSELEYSVFFAVAALLTAAGPFIWLKASRYVRSRAWPCCWQASSRPCCSASRSSCSPSRRPASAPTVRTSCYPSRRATRARRRRSSTSPIPPSATWACCWRCYRGRATCRASACSSWRPWLLQASAGSPCSSPVSRSRASRTPRRPGRRLRPSGAAGPDRAPWTRPPRRRGAPGSRRAAAAVRWMRAGWRQEAGAPAGHADAGAPAALPRLRRAGAIGAACPSRRDPP